LGGVRGAHRGGLPGRAGVVKPLLFVTGNAPPERVGAFAALHALQEAVFALFGGRAIHSTAGVDADLPFPVLRPSQGSVYELAASGRYRAVVCGTGGRTAFPAAFAGARRAGVPFVLWSSLWAHPRSLAGAAGWPLLARAYRRADAVVTYGPHVSRYVRAHGARNVFEAPQAVDNAFWGAPTGEPRTDEVLFVGRPERQKGWDVVREAWPGVRAVGPGLPGGVQPPAVLRNLYARARVVLLPSLPTPTVRETWGLVANEAMNQGTPVIATDAVGAAAGGLVRHERTGLVVPAGDAGALRDATKLLQERDDLWTSLSEGARAAVADFTFAAWTDGFSRALSTCGVAR
jgi:Glycosyl transferases group 1